MVRVLVQRVSEASVEVEGVVTGAIGRGLLALVGFRPGDDEQALTWMARKLTGLRIFGDAEEKMNLSVLEVGGEVLLVPQFTLYGDCRKGRRPSFTDAMPPEQATGMFDRFCSIVEEIGLAPRKGIFGAHMKVSLVNDGPVTLILDGP